MYIVKRPFRDANGMIPAGSFVEPAGVTRFKRRIQEGHIVEVNEHNFDEYATFFKQRYGVTIVKPTSEVTAEAVSTEAKAQPAKPAKPATKAVAKSVQVSKAVAK